jgi:hypothetical protein
MTAFATEQHPVIVRPFPSAMSPFAQQVQQATMAWAERFTLVRSLRARARMDRLQYGGFMARAYPTASKAALCLIADWNTWLFLLDDTSDEHALGHQPDELARLHARLLAILRGALPHAKEDTRYHALYDLTMRFDRDAPATWMRRFTRHVEATFAASVWEAHNRRLNRVPGEAAYLQMRQFTSAVYCFLSYIEVAEQLTLPAGVRNHATMQALSLMANNVISWFNDLISYPQEMARGDVHNLVAIVHRERGISLEHAGAYVIRKHNAEILAFQRVCATLPGDIRDQHGTQRYVIGLQAWIRANVDWSIATARYRPVRRPESPESDQHAI